MKRYPLNRCQRRLALLWYFGALLPAAVILVQTVKGVYPDAASAWNWLLPTLLPTLGLVTAVLGAETLRAHHLGHAVTADAFYFGVTFWLSVVYLATVLFTIFAQPFSTSSPADVLKSSRAVLVPFEGIVATSMGVFFAKNRRREKESTPAAEATAVQHEVRHSATERHRALGAQEQWHAFSRTVRHWRRSR
jgi:hypothetical protein